MPTGGRKSFRKLLALNQGEPFRIFFPLGVLGAVIGLGLWPLFSLGLIRVYPGIMHVRLMIEGFLAAFIVGFLGTAGPRLAAAPPLRRHELGALLFLQLAVLSAHLAGWVATGDALFCAELLLLLSLLIPRFLRSRELPPPSFILVVCGLFTGAIGAAILAGLQVLPQSPWLFTFGSLALTQGFVLLPILGAGAFLFPRLLGVKEGVTESASAFSWKAHPACSGGVALLLLLTFALEAAGFLRLGSALRCSVVAFYVAAQVPSALWFTRKPFLAQSLRCAVWSILAGFLWSVFLPQYRVAGLHFVFVGGFMAVVLVVATRVVLGHAGQLHLYQKRRAFLITTFVLLWIGLSARVGADFMSTYTSRIHHLLWAGLLCIAALLVWGIRLWPQLFVRADDDH